MASEQKEYGYIAYIDEAGDPGLKRVRPIDENGASEWLVLSAVVVKAEREAEVLEWSQEIVQALGITQRRDLHYRTLSPTRKRVAGEMIAKKPLRAFAVCSNKKNMRQYHNPRAAKVPSQQWFYNFCIRLLLERVTAFCVRRTQEDFGKVMPIKIEFSERGGIRYSQTSAYQHYLREQQRGGKIYLKTREPVMAMLDWTLMEQFPHGERAGLQLADFVASSFYQAIDTLGPGEWNCEPAQALQRIMAKENGAYRNFGVALFPTPQAKGKLTDEQRTLFEFYGYDPKKW